MEISHTLDGYWILSGYIDGEHEDAQAIMTKAKEQFIRVNPLIEPAKVVVVNGEFKQASFKQPTLADMARTDECRSLTDDMIAAMTNDTKVKEMLGEI
ncbi:hypothetical protein [Lactiplantibacillus pentosus]|uniref:Uncharacterized protein n=2 Tax=Lactiplantibacillus pentosus TaxID=1589 RepID=A0AB37RLA2_LACPE|nr:hypothetical protein [Lactiplantibacillus pentosus]RMW49939.1 hypothetical protein D6U20_00185 [Lactiplantibacillus pentosus]RMW50480.1 hypothetical protein D6U19_00085 [Lactiplantibacillus pentosus]RMW57307.1 hypothetical protein D6U17_00805 [Lactiplantibacillus pentosus]RMW57673.1 hypothetical protein D6U21_00710 [Lactiplantibacillus pentosus]